MYKYNMQDWSGKCMMWGTQSAKMFVLTKLTAWACMCLWERSDKQFGVHSLSATAVKACEDLTDVA